MKKSGIGYVIVCLLMINSSCFAQNLDSTKQEGKSCGEQLSQQALLQLKNFNPDDLAPADQQFDPAKAKELARKGSIAPTEPVQYLLSEEHNQNRAHIDQNESYLTRSNKITENEEEAIAEERVEYTLETCQQSDAPYPLSIDRSLQVEVIYTPEKTREVTVCQGHSINRNHLKKQDAKRSYFAWLCFLKTTPTIKSYEIEHDKVEKKNWRVYGHWYDKDNTETCNNYQTQQEILTPQKWDEIGDTWVYNDIDQLTIIKSPNCTYYEKTCLDKTPTKTVNGKEVSRQCWLERLTFLCKLPNDRDCPFIRDQNCELIKKDCIKEGPYGCSLWELKFHCYSKILNVNGRNREIFGMDEISEYEPNDSFLEVSSKLAVFEQIQNELQASQARDARYVQVFKGNPLKCSKSVADDLMYDCCFTYSGLAKQLKLTQCSDEELTLAEMREQGLCHYVGSYPEKFHDLWKSRDEHVFCCFQTKLARILQEQGRNQLSVSWGDPEMTNCRGLKLDEISSLDFSKMDFSELYESTQASIPEHFYEKLDSFQNRLKEKILEENE
ncbi:MAG: hypothetical protein S4CHLAM123_07970 [Chlamydiales bacterium]|nr:hypothetical protein [Chlamydiales bacterium]